MKTERTVEKRNEAPTEALCRVFQDTGADGRTNAEAVVLATIGKAKAGDQEARDAIGKVIGDSIIESVGAVGVICDRAGVSVKVRITLELK